MYTCFGLCYWQITQMSSVAMDRGLWVLSYVCAFDTSDWCCVRTGFQQTLLAWWKIEHKLNNHPDTWNAAVLNEYLKGATKHIFEILTTPKVYSSAEDRYVQWERLSTVFGPAVTLLPHESSRPTDLWGSVTLSGQQLFGSLVLVCPRVVKCELLLCIYVLASKQRQPRNHRVHTDRQHYQIRLAGVVDKTTHISHCTWIHKRFCDGATSCMFSHSYYIVMVHRILSKLPASSFLKTDHLSCILADKGSWWYRLQGAYAPAFAVGAKNLQSESQSSLRHTVWAGITAGTQGITLKHRWRVGVCSDEV